MGRLMLVIVVLLCIVYGGPIVTLADDPYLYFTWNVTYGTLSPLGVPQQIILINGQFPGPNINCTSNNNIVINVFNHIDEPFLLHWNGIQQRKNSWQDGVLGTNCPILPGKNYTYHFQVKDQIGSYYYFPSTAMHKAAGGFGGLHIHSRQLIPVPYPTPEDDYTVLAGDWYTKSHKILKDQLDKGQSLRSPAGIIINGKSGKVGDKNEEPLFSMKPGKTYKYRICNVGIRNSINFRIQGHTLKLVEIEGSHTVQNMYDSLDVHLGQCYGLLVTANQKPGDYYVMVSSRFTKKVLTASRILRYTNSNGQPASPVLPAAPTGWAWSLNQFRSFRWNLTASAARPNPQGSYHYGAINITRTVKLVNSAGYIGKKLRYAVNGVSHSEPNTPLKYLEYYEDTRKVFKYNAITDEPPPKLDPIKIQPIVLNFTFRTFIEIIFENHEKSVQSWHLNGYSFFPVAIEPGRWTPEKRREYNRQDAVSRHTIQVYPNSWAAILLAFDNAGMWNLRSEAWERHYLGQQLYISVTSPERSLRDEYNMPDNAPICGLIKDLPKPKPYTI